MSQNAMMLAALDARAEVLKDDPGTVEDRLRVAMRKTRGYWMVPQEEEQFKAAVGAVIIISDGEEKARLEAEMRVLAGLSAGMSGIPVDFPALMDSFQADAPQPIGLMRLWNEVKEEPR